MSRALIEQKLLPSVLSGASAGAIVAAILGTHGDDELLETLEARAVVEGFMGLSESSIELLKGNRRMGIDDLRHFVEHHIPDWTFQEAFERTGRRLNISISPRELHQQSRLMNAITSPNVFIRETVLASCAIPGIFPRSPSRPGTDSASDSPTSRRGNGWTGRSRTTSRPIG